MQAAITFEELLAYLDEESARWEQWFSENTQALSVQIDIAEVGDAQGMLHHIFAVEQLYVCRLRNEPLITPDQVPRGPAEKLFAIGRESRANMRAIVAAMDDAALDKVHTFKTLRYGEITASTRKTVAQVLVHSIRHWAQLATALRQAGHKQPWGHDLLLSSAMR